MRRQLLVVPFAFALTGLMLTGTARGNAPSVAGFEVDCLGIVEGADQGSIGPGRDVPAPIAVAGLRVGQGEAVRSLAFLPATRTQTALIRTDALTYVVHLPLVFRPVPDHSITNIVFDPPTPATGLAFWEPVTVTFSYSTTYAGAFRMWAIGYADGVRQPYRCSPLTYGPSAGTAVRAITAAYTDTETTIDTVEFLMRSDDGQVVLVDFTVPVQFTFTPWAMNSIEPAAVHDSDRSH